MTKIRLGRSAKGGQIAFSERALEETNWLITGAPGSMKSVLSTSWMHQYIQLDDHAVVFIDIGGDLASYHVMSESASSAGKPSYLVTLDETVDCYGWDMLANTPVFHHDPKRAVPGIVGALRLANGEGYPQTFWARHSAADINKAVDGLKAMDKWLFSALAEQLKEIGSESTGSKHVSEAFLAADELCRYTRALELRKKQLFLGEALEQGALVYFYVPSGMHGGAARSIAAAASWCVMVEAALRVDSGASKRTTHLVIDEYAQIAASGSTTEAILNLARKWNLQLTLILQSIAQVPSELKSVLRTNCQQAIFDAYTREEQEDLRMLSKDAFQTDSRSVQQTALSFGRDSETETVKREPSLSRNDILETSGIKSQFFLCLKLGDKYREPIVSSVVPAVGLERHRELKRRMLPRLSAPLDTEVDTEGSRFSTTPDPGLLELMNRIAAEQSWRP